MNPIVKNLLIALVILLVGGGLVYKAMNPSDYQDPRYRTSK